MRHALLAVLLCCGCNFNQAYEDKVRELADAGSMAAGGGASTGGGNATGGGSGTGGGGADAGSDAGCLSEFCLIDSLTMDASTPSQSVDCTTGVSTSIRDLDVTENSNGVVTRFFRRGH